MQITNSVIQVYEDLALGTKRAALSFADDTSLSLGGGSGNTPMRLLNLATPTINSDAVNKEYVDAVVSGLTVKAPVRVLADTDGTLATAYAAGMVIDGVTLVVGNRILLKAQTTATENGIWVVTVGAPTRPANFATGMGAMGAYAFVDEGTNYLDRAYVCTTNAGSDVIGTDTLTFVQFSARPSALAGYGLLVGVGNALDVNNTVIPTLSDTNSFTGATNTFTDVSMTGSLGVNGVGGITTTRISGLSPAEMTVGDMAVSVEYVAGKFQQFQFKEAVVAVSVADVPTPGTTLIAAYTLGRCDPGQR